MTFRLAKMVGEAEQRVAERAAERWLVLLHDFDRPEKGLLRLFVLIGATAGRREVDQPRHEDLAALGRVLSAEIGAETAEFDGAGVPTDVTEELGIFPEHEVDLGHRADLGVPERLLVRGLGLFDLAVLGELGGPPHRALQNLPFHDSDVIRRRKEGKRRGAWERIIHGDAALPGQARPVRPFANPARTTKMRAWSMPGYSSGS